MKKKASKTSFRKLIFFSLLLCFTIFPLLYENALYNNQLSIHLSQDNIHIIFNLVSIIAWLLGGVVTNLIIQVFFWEAIVAPKLGGKIPELLKNVLSFIVYFITVICILNLVFNLPVSGIWATSGVIGLVLGFALRSTLMDIFAGIAINIDQPYKVDDRIKIEARGIEPFAGMVSEITWRSTRILKSDGVIVIIPNSFLNTAVLTNMSKPDNYTGFELFFTFDFEISPDRVLRILEAGVKSAAVPLDHSKSKVKIDKVTEEGVVYKTSYWLDHEAVSIGEARHSVAKSILHHLHQAGLGLARLKQDIYYDKMPHRTLDIISDFTTILRRIEIFHEFEDAEIEKLSRKLKKVKLKAGTTVVRANDPGESMFIILEGLLAVFAQSESSGELNQIDQLVPGEFFGEMSLLTGETRSATIICVTDSVIFEIAKEDITEFLTKRPEMAENITRVIAERKTTIEEANKPSFKRQNREKNKTIADQLLTKMANFFGFG